jgi:hypothetical protein
MALPHAVRDCHLQLHRHLGDFGNGARCRWLVKMNAAERESLNPDSEVERAFFQLSFVKPQNTQKTRNHFV